MLFEKKTRFLVDFHSHILPRMDDGAKDETVSVAQLSALAEQGIGHVVATPHFYLHHETAEAFLARRQDRMKRLSQAVRAADKSLPGLSLGTEVYLEQGLLKMGGLERMRLADTRYVLFELPYSGVSQREAELLFNLCARNGVRPLLAHLDRYVEMLSPERIGDLLALPNVAVQINNEAFAKRQSAKFAMELIDQGVPVVLGSDTHNLTDRSPNFDLSNKYLAAKLKDDALRRMVKQQIAFLHGKI